jgi:hypothetical protein
MKLLDLDLAMDALARERNSLAKLIEMRYFGGMTAEETAEVVVRSVHVIRHELRLAHAWLRRGRISAGLMAQFFAPQPAKFRFARRLSIQRAVWDQNASAPSSEVNNLCLFTC